MTAVSKSRTVRKRVVVDEVIQDEKDLKQYEPVRFVWFNEEQKGVPVSYEWIDKWTPYGKCNGMFYDGQTYTLPRIAYEYYKQLSTPRYAQVEQELAPGMISKCAKEVGRNPRFRMIEVANTKEELAV